MGKYPRHAIIIRDKEYDLGKGINLSYDLDNLYINCSFNFPYIKTDTWDTTELRKYDALKIYYKEFDNADIARNATSKDMVKIFDGYIDGQPLQLNKQSGWQFQIKGKSRLGLTYERSLQINVYSGAIDVLIDRIKSAPLLTDVITNYTIKGIQPTYSIKIDTTKFIGKVLEQVKEKYALHIFEDGQNVLHIETPFYLTQQSTINAYEYDVTTNVYDIDFGDKTNRVDTVIVVGSNAVGIAFDPIAYQLKYGVRPENLQNNVNPNPAELSIRYIYRRDLSGQEDCQEVARNKLCEFAKNNTISFSTQFNPNQKVGEPFVIKNADKIPPTQLWTIKKIDVDIDNVTSTITGYSNSIIDFPEELLLSSTGILDTDILEVTGKAESALNIRE